MAFGGIRKFGTALFFTSNDYADRRVQLADNDPVRSTYSYAVADFTTITTAGDVAVLEYPATEQAGRLIRLRQIQISGVAGTTSSYALNVIKRSTLNTGGTRTPAVGVPRDSRLDKAIAALAFYTTAATPGTVVGPIDGGRLTLATSGGNTLDRLNLQYSWLNDMAPVLRTPGECFALNFGTALPAGAKLDISITWGEEEVG